MQQLLPGMPNVSTISGDQSRRGKPILTVTDTIADPNWEPLLVLRHFLNIHRGMLVVQQTQF